MHAIDRRRANERRKNTMHALWHGSFERRRRAPRRDGDAGLSHVDWHQSRWLAVAILVLLLSTADGLLTLQLLQLGAYEANPFMRPFVEGDGLMFALVKLALTSGGVVLLTLLAHARAFGRRVPVGALLYATLAAYSVLVIYEFELLRRLSALE